MHEAIHDTLDGTEYEPVRQLQTDDRNLVAEIRVAGRRAVCKVARDNPTGVNRDAAVHRFLRDREIVPVPEVLAAGDGWVVTEHCGADYDADLPRARRERRLRTVGAALARLHRETGFERCGDLRPASDDVELVSGDPWPERFLAFTEKRHALHAGERFEPVADAVRDAVRAHESAFAAADDPVLVHGDFEDDNLRFASDGLAAAIDWERCRAEPGEFDLARAELGWFLKPSSPEAGGALKGCIRDAYRGERRLPPGSSGRRALYRAAMTLGPLSSVDEVAARAGVVKHELVESTVDYIYDCLDEAEGVLA
jgi:Ser/Thr protein kinase RdoA (MazF antagonist)